MTKHEFKQAVTIAENEDLTGVDAEILNGCALPTFEPVYCTLKQVAKLILWQARQFNGQWDSFELDNCATIARRKFQIIG